MAILIIYIILGILYESFIHPLTILSGLPSAGFGALMTLMLFRLDLNIYGFVGLIMLVGIVKKNAIMMIDFAIEAQRSGKKPARGDSRRLPAAVPADHDDHHGRAHGHTAHCARPRRRRRLPQGPRPGRRRRIDGVAMPDALHHAGDLPLPGIVPPMVSAQSTPNARRFKPESSRRPRNARPQSAGWLSVPKTTKKVQPSPGGSSFTPICPPCDTVISRAMDNPSPAPDWVWPGTRKKRSNIRL